MFQCCTGKLQMLSRRRAGQVLIVVAALAGLVSAARRSSAPGKADRPADAAAAPATTSSYDQIAPGAAGQGDFPGR